MKTLKLIDTYYKLLKEQGEVDPEMLDQEMEGGNEMEMGADEMQQPEMQQPEIEQQEIPLTSEAENQYIKDMVDAALFVPSSDDAKTLSDLQGVIATKNFSNAREEILPILLNIIRPSTEDGNLRDDLDQID